MRVYSCGVCGCEARERRWYTVPGALACYQCWRRIWLFLLKMAWK